MADDRRPSSFNTFARTIQGTHMRSRVSLKKKIKWAWITPSFSAASQVDDKSAACCPVWVHHATVTKTNSRSVPTNPLSVNDHFLAPIRNAFICFHDVQCSTIVPNDENWSACRLTQTCTHKTKGKWEFKAWQRKLGHWQSNNKAFFSARLSFVRKIPSYSLYKCRAGASVANQINLLWSDKGATPYFFFLVV